MSQIVHARVVEQVQRLRLGHLAERLDAILSDAARSEPTYLDFLDRAIGEEVGSRQRKRIAMGIQIAHFPTVKTLDDFDFKFQPSIDPKLVRELATGRLVANAENVLLFGPPGVGRTHLAIALGRAVVGSGHSVLFVGVRDVVRRHRGYMRGNQAGGSVPWRWGGDPEPGEVLPTIVPRTGQKDSPCSEHAAFSAGGSGARSRTPPLRCCRRSGSRRRARRAG